MLRNILWAGREYYSLENCFVKISETGNEISSTIVGHNEPYIYTAEYQIHTNSRWETKLVEIKSRQGTMEQRMRLESKRQGKWFLNDNYEENFDGCVDIDISLTPFTNSLPINRLQFSTEREVLITVIYIDPLANQISVVQQKYRKLAETDYHFENVPNDFEADIKVDELGLVIDYPLLFKRVIFKDA